MNYKKGDLFTSNNSTLKVEAVSESKFGQTKFKVIMGGYINDINGYSPGSLSVTDTFEFIWSDVTIAAYLKPELRKKLKFKDILK